MAQLRTEHEQAEEDCKAKEQQFSTAREAVLQAPSEERDDDPMEAETGEPAGQKRSLSEDLEPEAKKAKTDEQKAQEQEAQERQEAEEKEAYLKLLAGQGGAQLPPELQETLWQTHRTQVLAERAAATHAKAATAKLQETLQGKLKGLTVQIAQLSKGGPAAGPRSG